MNYVVFPGLLYTNIYAFDKGNTPFSVSIYPTVMYMRFYPISSMFYDQLSFSLE